VEDERERLALELQQAREAGTLPRLRHAIYRAGERHHPGLAAAILDIAESVSDERTLESAAWALGKLGYHSAQAILQQLLFHASPKVVRGAAWALGELGDEAAREPLRRVHDHCEDAELQQIIGGALRKIAGLPVRTYVGIRDAHPGEQSGFLTKCIGVLRIHPPTRGYRFASAMR